MRKEEKKLQNTIVKNVYDDIRDRLSGIEEREFYTLSRVARYHSFRVYDYQNEIRVNCLIWLNPDNPEGVEWHHTAFVFKAVQLETSTIRLKGECLARDLDPMFDSYWDKILEDFAPIERQAEVHPEKDHFEAAHRERTKAIISKAAKVGAPSWPEDIWVWEQIHIHKKPKQEVKAEWNAKRKSNSRRKELVSPESQWRDITKPNWGVGKIEKNV